ncbi:unnamed protein product [Moneuplotes crassus]|uniref:Transmembrane protein n=1 Tax=Euplotes crassus TaxID=5936 RepID=A0AAD2D0D9_EUPCR|nr:unnamed protein product [Moneuplotes crassus]
MGSPNFNTRAFIFLATVTTLFLLFSLFINLMNIREHWKQQYGQRRRRLVIFLLINNFLIILMLYCGIWIYPIAGAFLIIIEVLICISLLLTFIYFRESIVSYSLKSSVQIQEVLEDMDEDKGTGSSLISQEFSQGEHSCALMSKQSDYYVSCMYLVEQHAHILPLCCKTKVNNFKKAQRCQKFKRNYLLANLVVLVIIKTFEYIVIEVLEKDIGSKRVIFGLIALFSTISCKITLITFSSDFEKTLKFEKFQKKTMTVIMMLVPLNVILFILRIIEPSIGPYNKDESQNLLFIGIYSIIIFLAISLQKKFYSASEIVQNEQKTEINCKISRDNEP